MHIDVCDFVAELFVERYGCGVVAEDVQGKALEPQPMCLLLEECHRTGGDTPAAGILVDEEIVDEASTA